MSKRILITGGGGPAAISIIKAIRDADVKIHVADMNPTAAGLFLVPEAQRLVVPAGRSPSFIFHLLQECKDREIDLLIPTVDCELIPVATHEAEFREVGTRVLSSPKLALERVLDKWKLYEHCLDVIPLPRTEPLIDLRGFESWEYPVIVKPREGSGSRGIRLVESYEDLVALGSNPELIVQDFLPGEEYSVDVLLDSGGRAMAAVPRVRMATDSGVSVASRTVHDEELIGYACTVSEHLGVRHVVNVQFRRDRDGKPRLLEINPRCPGTLPLTVQAGINMPLLAINEQFGESIPED
ncbi:MAG: ATP-grasp domain-containing protein, partial [Myxococcota bacterium]